MSGALDRTALAEVWPPTSAVAEAAGHKRKSPMQAIRERCLDCCCGQISEVRRCESVTCALWPFRAGQHPYTAARAKNAVQEANFENSGALHRSCHTEEAASSPAFSAANDAEHDCKVLTARAD
jgi:hypothetical protein